ncbi:MAG: dihydroorotate dehydrogenase-like protein [Ignavibacteria bacterium]|jgi:dihydroorotate dehydrogenase (fumarate)|nr:dihydroorotate dehydrogenase-like protein [Ignavibacteria bacterium]MCU7500643.1 dihydroorotate dehydrogenase-like protein [Ignavibacteria bacterium]MCU7512782.1 dihydroorotate dehydrogenase-like protein [Ignavibacteria bacterium]MCU7520336.1 dihydroorotate dehydrogenase-like protein [Ignavibacteria bacterium]MCU7523939.1 dihydroorotate dehydrogenase-like protein [Ignavibacteria bacterium]
MDLTTTYMGLKLKNPIVPSASPLSESVNSVKALEDAGASAVVVYSLFEEQISYEEKALDFFLTQASDTHAEALSYFPAQSSFKLGPEEYCSHIQKLKAAVDIPIIGSLNGVSVGGWMKYAKNIEEAGADALELNVYYIPTDPVLPGSQIEQMYLNNLQAVKENVKIPVAVKLSPYFSSMANVAQKLDNAGADALVMFNRFYQPDFDLDNLEVVPNLSLSSPWELRLPLRWISILYGKIKASMAATSGVHDYEDVIKVMMAGGDVTMVCSELLRHGPARITQMLDGMKRWMEEKEYSSVEQMKGSMSQKAVKEPAAFERANYMKTLQSYRPLL